MKGVDFRVAVDEVPMFTFEMFGLPEIEMSGEIRFSFTHQTVAEAATVIQKEFRRDTECYKALVASIESAIVENEDRYELAQDIADRILGGGGRC